jgi:hypothetical protein
MEVEVEKVDPCKKQEFADEVNPFYSDIYKLTLEDMTYGSNILHDFLLITRYIEDWVRKFYNDNVCFFYRPKIGDILKRLEYSTIRDLELINKIESFIIIHCMIDTNIIIKEQTWCDDENTNYIIKYILYVYEHNFRSVERMLRQWSENYGPDMTDTDVLKFKKVVKGIIVKHAMDSVKNFIKLIDLSTEEINIDEKKIADFDAVCIDVINWDDSANIHETLKSVDYIAFFTPVAIMREGTTVPLHYKYLAYTYPKSTIRTWFNDSRKIKYCDTVETGKIKTPYILCPMGVNCNQAYVSLWEILHIIRSTQRIFYILPSHFSDGPKHVCMRENIHQEEPREIIKIAKCVGENCWKWDKKTKCIDEPLCKIPPTDGKEQVKIPSTNSTSRTSRTSSDSSNMVTSTDGNKRVKRSHSDMVT